MPQAPIDHVSIPSRPAPRMAVRTVVAAFSAFAVILVAVVTVLALQLREQATRVVLDNLDAGRRMVALVDDRRIRTLTRETADLLQRLDVGGALRRLESGSGEDNREMRGFAELLERHVESSDGQWHVDAVVLVDRRGRAIARAGHDFVNWPIGAPVPAPGHDEEGASERVYLTGGATYRALIVPVHVGGERIGEVHVATALDRDYAESLSTLTRTPIVVVDARQLVACTLGEALCRQFAGHWALRRAVEGELSFAGETWATATLFAVGDAATLAVDSLSEPRRAAERDAWFVLGSFGLVLLLLAAAASMWLGRRLSQPIDNLSRTLSDMATSRRFTARIPRSGTSRELDALTDTFNDLMRSLAVAEGETQSAYVGAIRALAVALDARDPYTAGHSERVSALAVAIGRHMRLPERDMETLRLGALLHDIGKIGVADHLLGKPGPLTVDEFEAVKLHTRVGARILRPVPFLEPHLPIVELHHERPDGKGYPHGLVADEIPLLARIVRVADAFDAMTTARAYRPARPAAEALAELWRHTGSQFDTAVVEALATAWPAIPTLTGAELPVPSRLHAQGVLAFTPRAGGIALPH